MVSSKGNNYYHHSVHKGKENAQEYFSILTYHKKKKGQRGYMHTILSEMIEILMPPRETVNLLLKTFKLRQKKIRNQGLVCV